MSTFSSAPPVRLTPIPGQSLYESRMHSKPILTVSDDSFRGKRDRRDGRGKNSLLARFELGRIELLVEKGLALRRDSIKSLYYALNEAVLGHLGQPVAGVVSDRHIELLESPGCHISFIPKDFEDLLVDRSHPVRSLAHDRDWSDCRTHSVDGECSFAVSTYKCTVNSFLYALNFTASY